MANNRTEAKAAVTAAIVPAVSNAQHIALLNDEINESTVFRKDVIASETEAGGNVTIDYSNKDTATVTTAVNLAVSFTNIENGDVKYLSITKNATNTISFAGATDVSQRKTNIDNVVTLVIYQVFNKNGNIYVNSINIDNNIPEDGAWQTPTLVNGHITYTVGDYGTLRYRLLSSGMLQIAGSITRSSGAPNPIITTLDPGFRPIQTFPVIGRREDDTLIGGTLDSSGVLSVLLSIVAPAHLDFNAIFPMT